MSLQRGLSLQLCFYPSGLHYLIRSELFLCYAVYWWPPTPLSCSTSTFYAGFDRNFSIKINPFLSIKCKSLIFSSHYIFSKLLICHTFLWNPTNPTSLCRFYLCQRILFVYEVKTPWEAVVFHNVVMCLICFKAFDCLQVILNFM